MGDYSSDERFLADNFRRPLLWLDKNRRRFAYLHFPWQDSTLGRQVKISSCTSPQPTWPCGQVLAISKRRAKFGLRRLPSFAMVNRGCKPAGSNRGCPSVWAKY